MASVWLVLLSVTSLVNTQRKGLLCYNEVGCFPMGYPWYSTSRPCPPPHAPELINVKFYGYSRHSTERCTATLWPKPSLGDCPCRQNIRTAFITHGYINNGNLLWLQELKNNYLKAKADAIVFIVDWGKGAQHWNYLQAVSNTRIVGAELARFIKILLDKCGLVPGLVHLIGHSLGSQISAYAAKRVPGIGIITALDPAQPCFESLDPQVRLTKDDAHWVEALHSNAMPFLPFAGFGLIAPVGHADYYMNGGALQPGCATVKTDTKVKSITELTVEDISVFACSHCQAYEIYSKSLLPDCHLWGHKTTYPLTQIIISGTVGMTDPEHSRCDAESCVRLGLDTKVRGIFSVRTALNSPFCEQDDRLNKKYLREINEKANVKSVHNPQPWWSVLGI